MSEIVETDDKPTLLKAIELVLADPASIRKEALQLKNKYVSRYGSDRSEDEVNAYAADKIISNYSYYTAFIGGTTARSSRKIRSCEAGAQGLWGQSLPNRLRC